MGQRNIDAAVLHSHRATAAAMMVDSSSPFSASMRNVHSRMRSRSQHANHFAGDGRRAFSRAPDDLYKLGQGRM
jgi:hypothetical protein